MKFGHAAAVAMVMALPAAGNAAQQCDTKAFGVQMDQTAQALRTLNRESERRFHERLDALGKKQSWSEAQKADKAAAAMDDGKLEAFNNDIEELVARLDTLSATPNSDVSCARLSELKSVQEKLLAVMGQKSGFILAQLEAEGTKAPLSPYAQLPASTSSQPALGATAAPQEQAHGEQPAQPSASWSVNIARTPPLQPQSSAQRPAASASAQSSAPLSLKPAPSQPDTRVASLPHPSDSPLPAASGYTVQDIRDAGKGIFGSLTSEFAIVMNHAFQTYGEPNAYIVGDEGGGAFLAGLRYGDGKLYTRLNGVELGPDHNFLARPLSWSGFGRDRIAHPFSCV